MRYFRDLTPLLRILRVLGLLLPLVAILLLWGTVVPVVSLVPRWPVDAFRAVGIALDLCVLGGACTFVVNLYALRFRRPGRDVYPLDSWQSQVRWMLLLTVLPLGALAAAIFTPITPLLNVMLVVPLTLLAVLVYVAAWVYAAGKWQALN